ncbi:MAG: hypothetical protein IJZ22_04660, partial [Bacteroidaceae bacterium]|nr:hypothetical protein [Bacteroidaceae bacterium]
GGRVAISASLCPFDRREKSHSTMVIDFSHTFEMTRFFCLFYFGQTHRSAPTFRCVFLQTPPSLRFACATSSLKSGGAGVTARWGDKIELRCFSTPLYCQCEQDNPALL